MLNPNTRSLYTSALTPPPGMLFVEAIATSFSLDPGTLLTVPAHLAMLAAQREPSLVNGIIVLESLRRFADRITVYSQRGRILVPRVAHPLYGLLETMVVEVQAPRGGVFHPKCWLIKFAEPAGEDVLLRLLILSRNLTGDRSWDLALQLEGRPGEHPRTENAPLRDLLQALPDLASSTIENARKDQAFRLADEAYHTAWELPPGFSTVGFHVLGLQAGGWKPPACSRLAVISPFCKDEALDTLTATASTPEALITQPEALGELRAETRARFRHCLTLHEAAAVEDGEEQGGRAAWDAAGLHAKAYICECADKTHLFIGSANATNAALLAGSNVEILAELVGPSRFVGGIDELLGSDGFGEVLTETAVVEKPAVDMERQEAERALEAGRQALATADLRLRFEELPDGQRWQVWLQGRIPTLPCVPTCRAWPITVTDDHAVSLECSANRQEVSLGEFAAASLTRLIAFELTTTYSDLFARFVLQLPGDAVPEVREAAILQVVIANREGFLRYLLLLLGEFDGMLSTLAEGTAPKGGPWVWGAGGETMPLLEELTRAFSRDPARLRAVGRLVRKLDESPSSAALIPPEFHTLWAIFETALEVRPDA